MRTRRFAAVHRLNSGEICFDSNQYAVIRTNGHFRSLNAGLRGCEGTTIEFCNNEMTVTGPTRDVWQALRRQ
jgi:hypothetical protein